MPSSSYCLTLLGSKWLKTGNRLCCLWDEMVNERKLNILGQNQPRMETSSQNEDIVGTRSGTKKEDLNDKEKKDEEETPARACRANSILEGWGGASTQALRSSEILALCKASSASHFPVTIDGGVSFGQGFFF